MNVIPRISEKSFQLASDGVYIFTVPTDANKVTIKQAIEEQFKVTVVNIRTSIMKGKAKQSYQRRNQPVDGKRKNVKRAYVTLKSGDKLPFFEEVEA